MHKELSELQPLVEQWQQLQAWRAERADLLAMGSSESEPELAQLAQEELQGLAGRWGRGVAVAEAGAADVDMRGQMPCCSQSCCHQVSPPLVLRTDGMPCCSTVTLP